uniref:Selenoprotein S n=1 Tax=Neogobius melanostomus TaxID=47308 RepID=A0A8C6SRP8_9GOBI
MVRVCCCRTALPAHSVHCQKNRSEGRSRSTATFTHQGRSWGCVILGGEKCNGVLKINILFKVHMTRDINTHLLKLAFAHFYCILSFLFYASLVAKRQEALEAARMRMQEELDAKAALFKEKQKQEEEDKRRQKITNWDNMVQGKSSKGNASQVTSPQKVGQKPLRGSDYNPLSGDGGGSCAWRPGRRGPSSGG